MRSLVVVIAACALCGCSALLEELRPTYDARVLTAGTPRATLEQQLGKPRESIAWPDGHVRILYSTSRMSDGEKHSVVAGHYEGAVLTLGLSELWALPTLPGEDETRYFAVAYDAAGKVQSVATRCARDKQWWSATAPYSGVPSIACVHAAAPL